MEETATYKQFHSTYIQLFQFRFFADLGLLLRLDNISYIISGT